MTGRLSDERRQAQLFDYLADALDTETRDGFERFLEEDAQWARRLKREQYLEASLDALEPEPLPEGLAMRLKAGVRDRIERLETRKAFEDHGQGARIVSIDLEDSGDDDPDAGAPRPRGASKRDAMTWWAMAAATVVIVAVVGVGQFAQRATRSQVGAATQKMVGSISHDAKLEDYGADWRVGAEKIRENLMTHDGGSYRDERSMFRGVASAPEAAAPEPRETPARGSVGRRTESRQARSANLAPTEASATFSPARARGVREEIAEHKTKDADESGRKKERANALERQAEAEAEAGPDLPRLDAPGYYPSGRLAKSDKGLEGSFAELDDLAQATETAVASAGAPVPAASLPFMPTAPDPSIAMAGASTQDLGLASEEEARAQKSLFEQEEALQDLGQVLGESNLLALQTLEATLAKSGLEVVERKMVQGGQARLMVIGPEPALMRTLAPVDEGFGSEAPESNVLVLWDPNARLEAPAGDLDAALESLPEAEGDGSGMPAMQMNAVRDLEKLKQQSVFNALGLLYVSWERRPLDERALAEAQKAALLAEPEDAAAGKFPEGPPKAFALNVTFFPETRSIGNAPADPLGVQPAAASVAR